MAVQLTLDTLETKNYASPTKAIEMVNKGLAKFHPDVQLQLDLYIHAQTEAKGIRYYPVLKFRREADFALYVHAVGSLGFRMTL